MITRTRALMSLNVGQACRVMGFTAPPLDKRILKKRYVELVKKHHPDQHGPNASADRMVIVTEAYKTLGRLLDDGRRGRAPSDLSQGTHTSSGNIHNNNKSARDEMEAEAAAFVAPGAPLSMAGWTLPWQRGRTVSSQKLQEQELQKEVSSLHEYVRKTRAIERELLARADRAKAELKMSEGSHGFTAKHFEEIRRMQQRDPSWALKRKPLIVLIGKYYRKRLSVALSRWWDAVQYVFLGR
ncbi:chaperone protein DNAJ [Trypanosoma theileri]|uniref:Chaperone protein DNAJ n=1 Tax=Trypanosoma theileri TaxID=67003 RepID=A0A1X0NRW0_9TRYP|nr:chaperone protein DNAJ [Trypanosoma theileri]ORC86919.1 chaperone protein DNAJ [Trypanosoma theileri]